MASKFYSFGLVTEYLSAMTILCYGSHDNRDTAALEHVDNYCWHKHVLFLFYSVIVSLCISVHIFAFSKFMSILVDSMIFNIATKYFNSTCYFC